MGYTYFMACTAQREQEQSSHLIIERCQTNYSLTALWVLITVWSSL